MSHGREPRPRAGAGSGRGAAPAHERSHEGEAPEPSRLRFRDAVAVAVSSLRSRALRAVLTAGGVAIGIGAMVAVLGVSTSSRADLLATLDALGTDLLTVTPGRSFVGVETPLPVHAAGAARRMASVEEASATASVDAFVRRTDRVPATQTGGIRVVAAESSLLDTLHGELTAGTFLDEASDAHPTVVLGAATALQLGIHDLQAESLVWLGDEWFTVVGMLEPLPLAPELDRAALIGLEAAAELTGRDTTADAELVPTTIYVRAIPGAVDEVRPLLPPTVNPESPEAVQVSRPSDALAARAAADRAFTALLLGLAGVALVVGGIGIANIMVVSVLERRVEIGLRRALGATRRHIRAQFLLEAVTLSAMGGIAGVLLGAAITAVYAIQRGWPFALPVEALFAGAGLALLVGGLAGLYPATRAARLQPAQAVRPN